MKNYLLGIIMFLFVATPAAFSQIEAKINPVGFLWGGDVDLSIEYLASDEFGIEARIPLGGNNLNLLSESFRSFRTGAIFSGRYYFSPEVGADKFYAGGYAKYIHTSFRSDIDGSENNFRRNRFALGVLFGYKWVSDRNILVDVNFGVGRALSDNYSFDGDENQSIVDEFEGLSNLFKIDFVSSLAVGYRFGLGSRKR